MRGLSLGIVGMPNGHRGRAQTPNMPIRSDYFFRRPSTRLITVVEGGDVAAQRGYRVSGISLATPNGDLRR
jgi:hypothetical protein